MFLSALDQALFEIPLGGSFGPGLYFINILDNSGSTLAGRKLVIR